MKKNVMMRLASFLLVAVLISTSAISGTYAKYTTQDSGSDSARVAKWGVELQVFGNLYGDTYKNLIVEETATDLTVQSVDKTADVVAPGTKNEEGFTFSLNGTPEVDSQVTAKIAYENIYLTAGEYGVMVDVASEVITAANYDEFVDGADLYVKGATGFTQATGWDASADYYTLEDYVNLGSIYYPVEYSLIGGDAEDTNYNVLTSNLALPVNTLEVISGLIGGRIGTAGTPVVADGRTEIVYTSDVIPTNTNLKQALHLGKESIKWTWDFCQLDPECSGGNSACEHCKADTILGNLMAVKNGEPINVVKLNGGVYAAPADVTDFNLETEFSIDITVTQVD